MEILMLHLENVKKGTKERTAGTLYTTCFEALFINAIKIIYLSIVPKL